MYQAELFDIKKSKYNGPEKYTVHLCVDYHEVEEEAIFRYSSLKDIPRYLISIEDGKVKFRKGLKVQVSHPFEDANGLVFLYIYEGEQ